MQGHIQVKIEEPTHWFGRREPLLHNKDIVTHSCNTFIIVLQRSLTGTHRYVLQVSVVTHNTCYVKLCYRIFFFVTQT